GPTVGWCTDDVRQREDKQFCMSNHEICSALRDSKIDKLDLLTFSACLMGSAEEAAAFSPYTDNIVFSSENLNLRGLIFDGMIGLLRNDPLTDGYTLGRRIVDDTVTFYVDNRLSFGVDCTLTVLNTKNFRERLVPKLTELSELLIKSVTEPDKNGKYRFYDELASATRAVEFGEGTYQLRDLGDFVSELGINYSEFTEEEDDASLASARNEYTDLCVNILNILSDENVLYHRATDSKKKSTAQTYRRDSKGKLYDSGENFYATTGLSVYFDLVSSWSAGFYSEQIEGMLSLAEINEATKTFLTKYRDASMLYSLLGSAGRAVFALKNEGNTDVTPDDIMKYWKDNGLWVINNSNLGVHDSGISDVCDTLKKNGYDVDTILAEIVKQQYRDLMSSDGFSVYRTETAGKSGEYDSIKIISDSSLSGQTDSVYMRLKLKSDYNYFSGSETVLDFLKNSNFSYCDKLMSGSVSADDAMRAAYRAESTSDYLRTLSEENSAFEIGIFDGEYYTLLDSEGNRYLVQALISDSLIPRVQVPVQAEFRDDESGSGQIEFVFDEKGVGHAVNFVPGNNNTEFSAGIYPISDKMFYGAEITLMLNA
ncbi:MAG: hypothetical protein IK093_03965, partial [Ruminiclostridium sp.]|nr:hypothetical protein [Ruminiclostridium sp.]